MSDAPSDVRRVLFVELLGGFGDLLIALPAIQALALSHPRARHEVLTFAPGAELLARDPHVDAVHVAPEGGARAAVARLLAEGFDLVVSDTAHGGIDALIAEQRAPRAVTDLWRDPPDDERVEARFVRLLREDGLVTGEAPAPHLFLAPEERAEGAALRPHGGPWVALLIDAGMPIKRWPPERFARLGRALAERRGARVLVVGGADRAAAHEVAAAIGPAARALEPVPLRRLAGVLAAADLAVAADTGPGRLAALTGTPTLMLFGPAWSGRYALPAPHVSLQGWPGCPERRPADFTRQACWYAGRCPLPGPSCMEALGVEEVAEAAARLLDGASVQSGTGRGATPALPDRASDGAPSAEPARRDAARPPRHRRPVRPDPAPHGRMSDAAGLPGPASREAPLGTAPSELPRTGPARAIHGSEATPPSPDPAASGPSPAGREPSGPRSPGRCAGNPMPIGSARDPGPPGAEGWDRSAGGAVPSDLAPPAPPTGPVPAPREPASRPARPRDDRWRRARRLLVLRLDNIGDVLMTAPALRAIKETHPGVHLTLMASPAGAQAAPLLSWVDDTLMAKTLWQDLGALPFEPGRERALIARLREGRFDGAIVLTSFSQSPHPAALVCRMAGIARVAGASRERGASLTDPAPKGDDAAHQAERNLALVRHLGFEARDDALSLAVPAWGQREASDALAAVGVGPGESFVLAAPWASAASRVYDPARMADALRRIARATGGRVALTAGPGDAERTARLARAVGPAAADLAGRTSVPALAALVGRARLVVTVNTSVMHMADALGAPAVVLFAGTELPSQWAPRRAPHRLLRRATPCSPCHAFACPLDHACLDIEPRAVAEAALALLAETRRPAEAPAGAPAP